MLDVKLQGGGAVTRSDRRQTRRCESMFADAVMRAIVNIPEAGETQEDRDCEGTHRASVASDARVVWSGSRM